MNNEVVVYLLRKTSLTRTEIGKLSPAQFNELFKEVYYQESLEVWREQHSVASLLAAVYNTIPRKRGAKTYKVSDFLKGSGPERHPVQTSDVEAMAEERGIRMPNKELIEIKGEK